MTDDDLIAAVCSEFGLARGDVSSESKLVDDLSFDSIELLRLAVVIDELAPGFSMPEQLAVEDIAIRDIAHYIRRWLGGEDAS